MKFSRRFILRGAGAAVAIPVLPSLLTASEARAQAAANPRCFAHFATNHGGVWAANMFPAAPSSGVETQTYAGREIRRFPLAARRANGMATISPVLSAPDARLPDSLIAKMFSVQGVDIPFYIAHNTGGHLGNFARNDGNGGDGELAQMNAQRRTIDQIMAWSPAFYPDLSVVKERVMLVSSRMSYNFSNPQARTGTIQEITPITSTPTALFDQLFPQTGGTARPPIIDKVLESYTRLRNSPRLSAADKVRLDDHVQRVHELQRRLTARVSCSNTTRPSGTYAGLSMGAVEYNQPYALDPAAHGGYFQALNDVLVLAMSCGISRISVARIDPIFSTFMGDWHQDVAHQTAQPDGMRQQVMWESHQRIFADVVVDLARKMDAVDMGDGKTLLDRSLVAWTQESGNYTHENQSMPVIGFGSADGFLRTGWHVDYRNRATPLTTAETERRYPGLMWHQWLGTVLQAMGIPKSEWENAAVNPGYPDYKFAKVNWVELTTEQAYPASVWTVAGEVLPWLKA